MTVELPLFPLRSVLCPGVALPLHIFEDRYRLMIGRCLERGEPFGVVLVREGHEVGPVPGRIADVGTTAIIRRAGRYPDGRLDILTVGERRFRLESLDTRSEPYLVGRVDDARRAVRPRRGRRRAGATGRPALPALPRAAPAGRRRRRAGDRDRDRDGGRRRGRVCRGSSARRRRSAPSRARSMAPSRSSPRWTQPT